MAMKTPEKQILPIAPSYPDLNALTRWAGDLTRTLAQNLSTIARKANDENSFTPVADLDMQGFSITNINNLGNISGTITYKGADIDTRYVNVTGDTMTGDLEINNSGANVVNYFAVNSVGALGLGLSTAGNVRFVFDDTKILAIQKDTRANIDAHTLSPTTIWSIANTGAVTMTGALAGATTGSFSGAVSVGGLLTGTAGATIGGGVVRLDGTGGSTHIGSLTAGNYGIELGYTGGSNTLSFLDFHTSATVVDYDVRMLASGNAGVAGAGALSIGATAGVTIDGPVIISGAAAGQVVFPATQNPSAGANTLDDYEENSWTVTIDFGGGTTGITYGTRAARYVKIGQLVIAQFDVALTAKGSSTGVARITGLPFTSLNDGQIGSLAIAFYSGMTGLTGGMKGYVNLNATTAQLVQDGAAAVANLTDAAFTNTSRIVGTAIYRAA